MRPTANLVYSKFINSFIVFTTIITDFLKIVKPFTLQHFFRVIYKASRSNRESKAKILEPSSLMEDVS